MWDIGTRECVILVAMDSTEFSKEAVKPFSIEVV